MDQLPNISPEKLEEMKKRQKQLKTKLDKFKIQITKNFKKEIIGIAILPPKKAQDPKKENKQQINVLVLIDDSNSKTIPDFKLKDKIAKEITKTAEKIDKNINLEIMITSELKEACFDGKNEILQLIAMSAPIYDPMDVLVALKTAEIHKTMILKKFEKYIVSYIGVGSLFRGEKSNDIDVSIIIDDTDVKRMTRAELKDKLRAIIINHGFQATEITGTKKQFHIQVHILTDFWDSVKDANPVVFTFLRDGVPFYDRGTFTPWRLLLKMGKIKPSPESIEMHMDIGKKLLDRAKKKLMVVATEDLYYALLNPAQAALMLYGIPPSTPKETIKLLDEIFVKKEKLLEKKYVITLEKVFKFYKGIEHGEIKSVSGREIDAFLKSSEEYLKRLDKLFKEIEKTKEKENFSNIYDTVMRVTEDVIGKDKKSKPETKLKKYCEQTGLPLRLVDTLKATIKAKKELQAKKLTKAEINKLRRETRIYVKTLAEHIQRINIAELERATIKFRYGNSIGEVIILGEHAFITPDINAEEKTIQKTRITKEGGLSKIESSKIQEMEQAIMENPIKESLFIKEKLFSDLKGIFGENLEIML
ncbi:hypothetical protein HOA59_02980 [archaeon]|jgi:uncharacterized protein (UPF0332 family)|nr:hypothetical protein [archaeon]MBT6824375.1 hypothetical protein [archaeon]MBT7106925.1 hypothetical protein [archaeon]MBT7297478.1 hypothetical protein [archaeon]